jgi:hypothetical protein
MQLAIGALGKVLGTVGLSGVSTGAPVVAGAVPVVANTATSALLTAFQGISTVIGVLGQIGAGQAQADQLNQQAGEADLQSGQEQLQGQQRQNRMRRELARVLGQNDVTYAAAGIDLSGGVAKDQAQTAKQQAASEISIDQQDVEFRRALYKQRALRLRQSANDAVGGSMLKALGTAADFGLSIARRG